MERKYLNRLFVFLMVMGWATIVFSGSLVEKTFYRGLKMGQQGDFMGAEIFFKNVLAKDLMHIPARRSLDLIKDYQRGWVKSETVILIFRGFEHFYKYQNKAAINVYKQAILKNPNYYLAHHNLGSAYYQEGKANQAIKSLKTALKLNPRYPYTHNNLGLAYDMIGNYYTAIKHYKQAIKIDPTYYKVYNNIAGPLWKTKKYEEADAMVRKALKINPKYATAYLNVHIDKEMDKKDIQRVASYSIDELINMVIKGNWKDQKIAAQILSSFTNPKVLEQMCRLLKHSNAMVRATAAKILGNQRSISALDCLLERITEKDWTVREEIVHALGMHRNTRALFALHNCLLKDEDYHVRKAAARALYRIRDPSSLDPLEQALKDPIYYVRKTVLWVLAYGFDTTGHYMRLFKEKTEASQKTKHITDHPRNEPIQPVDIKSLIVGGDWDQLIQIGEPALNHLLEVVNTQNSDFPLEILMVMGDIGNENAVEALINQLSNPNLDVRFYTAEALGKIKSRRTIPVLIELLSDPHWKVKNQAAESLGMITGQFFGENQEEWRKWWEENQ